MSEELKDIRKRFDREWLLIAIPEADADKAFPPLGKLIAHSPRQDDIYEALLQYKGRSYMTFSDDNLPMGYAAAF